MYDKTGMLICTIFGGWFGLHKFMKKETGMGILYLLTFGLFGVGWIVDIITTALSKQPRKVVIKQNNRICLNCGANIFTDDNFCQNCGADLNMMMLYGSNYRELVPLSEYADAYTSRKATKITRNYVVFDTETTGLEPSIDKIIELSAIKYVDNKKVASFSMLINPKRQIDSGITRITGITNHELEDKPTIDKALDYFFNFIEDYTLVAHNAKFDIKMLACECYRNGIEMPDNKVIDTYIDGGESGQKIKRTNLQRLLRDVEANKIDLVIMTKLDRWFRNVADFYKVIEVLKRNKVNWKTIWEDYDTTTASGEFWLNMSLALGQMEAKRTGERISEIFEHKFKYQKTVCSGNRKYGYNISEEKKYVINEEEAQNIKDLYNHFINTENLLETVKWFKINKKDIGYASIKNYLKDISYTGKYLRKKTGELIDDFIPQIIDKETFKQLKTFD